MQACHRLLVRRLFGNGEGLGGDGTLEALDANGVQLVTSTDGIADVGDGSIKRTRQHLIDENQLEAVISLPSGVFKPYAGVSTAILIFTKGGRTDDVMFYDVQADGFSLDDKRQPIDDNDLPDVLVQFQQRRTASADFSNRAAKAFAVPVADIRGNKYELSINRYKKVVQEEAKFDPPAEILERMKNLEAEIQVDMSELEEML